MENKTVTYERLMEAIYDALQDEETEKNVIETKELKQRLDNYVNKYLEPIFTMSKDLHTEMWEELIEIVFGYCRSGFVVKKYLKFLKKCLTYHPMSDII